MEVKVALTIAGSDPSGGAGLQMDLKVFQKQSVFGMAISSLETVQNSHGVKEVQNAKAEFIIKQLKTLKEDFKIHAIKTGALGSKEQIIAISNEISAPLIIDPVLASTSTHDFFDQDSITALKESLIKKAFLITPNINEAEIISGIKITNQASIKASALAIKELGAKNVLIKGGHLESSNSTDFLFTKNEEHEFSSKRIDTPSVHGTGCAFSAFITAEIAKGTELIEAIKKAKDFINLAIKNSLKLGSGTRSLEI